MELRWIEDELVDLPFAELLEEKLFFRELGIGDVVALAREVGGDKKREEGDRDEHL